MVEQRETPDSLHTSIPSLDQIKTLYETAADHKSFEELQVVRALLDDAVLGDDSLKAEILHRLGTSDFCRNNPDTALFYQREALEMRLRLYGSGPHITLVRSNNDLAGWYAGKWEYRRSLDLRLKTLSSARSLPSNDATKTEIIRLCNNIGELYRSSFDFDLAQSYYQMGLAEASGREEKFHYFMIVLYTNLAENELSKNNDQQAVNYLSIADSLHKCYIPKKLPHDDYWLTLGNIHLKQSQPDSALYYYHIGYQQRLNTKNANPRLVSVGHHSLARAFYVLENYDSCLFHLHQMIDLEKKLTGEVHVQNVDAYLLMAKCYLARGLYQEALTYFNASLLANNYHGDIQTIIGYEQAISSFQEIASIHYKQYLMEGKPSLLEESLNYCELAAGAAMLKRRMFIESYSKEILNAQARRAYETAIIACEKLFQISQDKQYTSKAFYFSEQAKSLNLLDVIQSDQAALDAEVPTVWLERENELRKEIAWRKTNFANNKLNRNDSRYEEVVEKTNQDIHALLTEFDSIILLYKKEFPDFYQAKYADIIPDTQELEAYCKKENTTLLSYFHSPDKYYLFIVHPLGIELEVKRLPANYEKVFHRFGKLISETPPIDAPDTTFYNRLRDLADDAHRLYQILMPAKKQLLNERLMIIPDGELAYLPFSILLDKPVLESDLLVCNYWPYLIKTHTIAYCYSATLLQRMEQKNHWEEPTCDFIGVAPDFSNESWSNWIPVNRSVEEENMRLIFNDKEVNVISNCFDNEYSDLLIGAAATRDNLLLYLYQFKIIHFSTHAFAFSHGGDDPFLALTNPKDKSALTPFYFRDVRYLKLNADMVVLSACRTALGRLSRTEGLISLGQAFAYAGAKSIVPTLWNIKDSEANVVLMQFFYENINAGLAKDRALQKAQLDFLTHDKYRSSAYADPHYWAAFSLIGDRAPLSF